MLRNSFLRPSLAGIFLIIQSAPVWSSPLSLTEHIAELQGTPPIDVCIDLARRGSREAEAHLVNIARLHQAALSKAYQPRATLPASTVEARPVQSAQAGEDNSILDRSEVRLTALRQARAAIQSASPEPNGFAQISGAGSASYRWCLAQAVNRYGEKHALFGVNEEARQPADSVPVTAPLPLPANPQPLNPASQVGANPHVQDGTTAAGGSAQPAKPVSRPQALYR